MMTLGNSREGMREGATELPREPKEDSVENSTLGEDVHGIDSSPICERVLDPKILFLVGDDTIGGSASTPMAAPTIYVPGWGITRESLLSQHATTYDWGCHAFPPATIEALALLSNSHLSNNLLCAAVQVGPYVTVTVSSLRQGSSSSSELASVKVEQDELRARFLELGGRKRSFEKRYDLLEG